MQSLAAESQITLNSSVTLSSISILPNPIFSKKLNAELSVSNIIFKCKLYFLTLSAGKKHLLAMIYYGKCMRSQLMSLILCYFLKHRFFLEFLKQFSLILWIKDFFKLKPTKYIHIFLHIKYRSTFPDVIQWIN